MLFFPFSFLIFNFAGAPAIVSFPHFLYADPIYLSKVEGMKPDPELHKFIIDLEPVCYFLTVKYAIFVKFL